MKLGRTGSGAQARAHRLGRTGSGHRLGRTGSGAQYDAVLQNNHAVRYRDILAWHSV